jgi:hypothetical protein
MPEVLIGFSIVYLCKEIRTGNRPARWHWAYVCFQRSGLSDLAFPGFQEKDAANGHAKQPAASAPRYPSTWSALTDGLPTAFPAAIFEYKVTTVSTERHWGLKK